MKAEDAKKRLRICPLCGPVEYTEYPLGKICIECIDDSTDTARTTSPYRPGLEKMYEKKQALAMQYDAYWNASKAYRKEWAEFIDKTKTDPARV